jgi:hypothetical protein
VLRDGGRLQSHTFLQPLENPGYTLCRVITDIEGITDIVITDIRDIVRIVDVRNVPGPTPPGLTSYLA